MERLKDRNVELCRLFVINKFTFPFFVRDNEEIKDNQDTKVKKNIKKISA